MISSYTTSHPQSHSVIPLNHFLLASYTLGNASSNPQNFWNSASSMSLVMYSIDAKIKSAYDTATHYQPLSSSHIQHVLTRLTEKVRSTVLPQPVPHLPRWRFRARPSLLRRPFAICSNSTPKTFPLVPLKYVADRSFSKPVRRASSVRAAAS
jgi:hypothetical protein